MGLDVVVLVFWMLSFRLAFSTSSRGSLVSLHFLSLEWYHLHIWGYWYFSQQSWFQLVIHPAQHLAWYTLLWVCTLRCFSRVRVFVTLWTVAPQAPLSMGFSRQEYWNGLPCPPPGHLSNPGIKSVSLPPHTLAGRLLTTNATWEALDSAYRLNKQGNNIQHCHTPFPVLSQSVVPRLVLTVACWRIMDRSS